MKMENFEMKRSKLIELHGVLNSIAVLQHFIDSEPGKLFIGMIGVDNQVGIHKELDMKIRILLGVQIEKMEEQLKTAGIDMTPEKASEEPESEKATEKDELEKASDTATEYSVEENAGATGS